MFGGMLIRLSKIFSFIILPLAVLSCISTGSISLMKHNDKSYFKEPPSIIEVEGEYILRWQYANPSHGLFSMMADFKISANKLLVYVPITTSSGYMNNKIYHVPILNNEYLNLIKSDSVYWVNPDKELVKIKITPPSKEDLILIERN